MGLLIGRRKLDSCYLGFKKKIAVDEKLTYMLQHMRVSVVKRLLPEPQVLDLGPGGFAE